MAAMYHLFCSVLFIAVCSNLGTIPLPIKKQSDSHQLRTTIINIAQKEIGVREATGNNDGERVEEYLAYTGLGKGYAWCAAFISWCYGQAGLSAPRNPWSPALLPRSKTYCSGSGCLGNTTASTIAPADIFGIYSHRARRINHVGLIKAQQGRYLVTIEGNVADKVLSKRRHLATVYAIADWVSGKE